MRIGALTNNYTQHITKFAEVMKSVLYLKKQGHTGWRKVQSHRLVSNASTHALTNTHTPGSAYRMVLATAMHFLKIEKC